MSTQFIEIDWEPIKYEQPSYPNIEWQWFDKKSQKWITATESDSIEEEYQDEINNKRSGYRVYHCFGKGYSAHVNFKKMQTSCGSGRCIMANHKSTYINFRVNPPKDRELLDDDHMMHDLKRVVKE